MADDSAARSDIPVPDATANLTAAGRTPGGPDVGVAVGHGSTPQVKAFLLLLKWAVCAVEPNCRWQCKLAISHGQFALSVGKLHRRPHITDSVPVTHQVELACLQPSQARGSRVGRPAVAGARRADVTTTRPHHEASYGNSGETPPRQHHVPAVYVILCTVVRTYCCWPCANEPTSLQAGRVYITYVLQWSFYGHAASLGCALDCLALPFVQHSSGCPRWSTYLSPAGAARQPRSSQRQYGGLRHQRVRPDLH